jgi:uncharacterized protein YbjT (DUF2867 family)
MKIKAIIFGATGMVGEGVLHESLKHPDVESVLAINRRPCHVGDPKLKELLHDDFYNYLKIEEHLKSYNACYFCLGVSSVGKKEKDYMRVTYDLTMQAANTLSRLNPDMTFCYVSGEGTHSTEKGRFMWARVKGKTENDLLKLPFKAAYMFRPGFIKPIKGLKNAYGISKALGLFYPVLKALLPKHVCTLEDLGTAMINVTMNGYHKNILENTDIDELGRTKIGR